MFERGQSCPWFRDLAKSLPKVARTSLVAKAMPAVPSQVRPPPLPAAPAGIMPLVAKAKPAAPSQVCQPRLSRLSAPAGRMPTVAEEPHAAVRERSLKASSSSSAGPREAAAKVKAKQGQQATLTVDEQMEAAANLNWQQPGKEERWEEGDLEEEKEEREVVEEREEGEFEEQEDRADREVGELEENQLGPFSMYEAGVASQTGEPVAHREGGAHGRGGRVAGRRGGQAARLKEKEINIRQAVPNRVPVAFQKKRQARKQPLRQRAKSNNTSEDEKEDHEVRASGPQRRHFEHAVGICCCRWSAFVKNSSMACSEVW